MSVTVNYLLVIMIWATTPLAIKLSSTEVTPYAALLMRIGIAFSLLSMLVACFKSAASLKKDNWKVYVMASMSLFPNMLLVYLAAQYIPSGLIAVMFAMTPMTTGIIYSLAFKESFFTRSRVMALALALLGLALIFSEQWTLTGEAYKGFILMVLSNTVFSLSQVGVKYFSQGKDVHALEQTLGSMAFALPGLAIMWVVFDGHVPHAMTNQSIMAIVYLGIIGSLVGFAAYYVILSNMSIAIVSLVPLITPVLALWLGSLLLHEAMSQQLIVGTLMIIAGLVCYEDNLQKAYRRVSAVFK